MAKKLVFYMLQSLRRQRAPALTAQRSMLLCAVKPFSFMNEK
jgi:hypothetical protein